MPDPSVPAADSTPDVDFSDLEAIRELAQTLDFVDDPDVLADCLAAAESLYRDLEMADAIPDQGTATGHRSTDAYNALLHVYDEPRVEQSNGELGGMRIAIKDNIAVKDLPMTGGFAGRSYVPSYDALVVERVLDAGAAVVGKANMDALALGPEGVWSEIDQVRNSIAADRVPGGSSSGSAVAVATGQADAALGSDAGGSVRKPAAYNELVAIKPTQGIVPTYGKLSSATTLGSIGPIAETVEATARVLDTIAGPDRRDPGIPPVEVGPLTERLGEPLDCTVGVPGSFMDCADPGVRAVIEALAERIATETGCETRPVELDNTVSALPSYLSGPELAWLLRQRTVDHGAGRPTDPAWYALSRSIQADGFNEHITRRKLPGAYVDQQTQGLSYLAAYEQMLAFRDELAAVFEDVDLLLSPTVPAVPPRLDADIEHLPRNLSINCQPFNLSGSPAVAVPAGRVDGLPVSAQIAAPSYEDGRALRGARLVETLVD